MRKMKKFLAIMLAAVMCMYLLAGCGDTDEVAVDVPDEPEYEEEFEEDFEEDFEEPEEIEEDDEVPEETETADAKESDEGSGDLSNDEIVELAKKHSGAPKAELDQVMDNGNLYIHLYEEMDDHDSTWDWYEIDPRTLKGTNFMGEEVDLNGAGSSGTTRSVKSSGDPDGVVVGVNEEIDDGEYVTDDEYTGEVSTDGKTLTITTALYKYVNSPAPEYQTHKYVFNVSDSCKCTIIREDSEETSFTESIDLISEFLEGKSGLPITLTIKNNELVGIMFTS
ncbi:MAG: hypothetical protein K6F86_08500 [Lachnospiraceae bacterium]|nr:hypothetical protein [Lachnospiraceae bacterium]